MTIKKSISKIQEKNIVEIEFEIFENLESIEIKYSYDKKKGTVDIGIRNADEIIGWSGGARSSFTLSENNSTPGYKNYKLFPQKFIILLGIYKINTEDNLEIEIEIIQKKKQKRWIRGITHLHSNHSDGSFSFYELLEKGKKYKMDYLIFTDHNTVSQNIQLQGIKNEMLLIPGMEFTSYEGHANFVGLIEPLRNFHWKAKDFSWKKISEEAIEKGAYIGINHPFCFSCNWNYEFENFHWIELWNSVWSQSNELCRVWWTDRLKKGDRIPIVGGSDFHKIKEDCDRFLTPVNYVLAEGFTKEDVLLGMKRGNCIIKDDNYNIELTFKGEDSEVGEETKSEKIIVEVKNLPENNKVILVTDEKETIISQNKSHFFSEMQLSKVKFAYLFIKSGENVIAITNPLYFKRYDK